jgi:hypothetical protein
VFSLLFLEREDVEGLLFLEREEVEGARRPFFLRIPKMTYNQNEK